MTAMPVLTSVVEERVRVAVGEDDDVGVVWAHGGADVPTMLRRRRGEHGVDHVEAKLVVWSMVPGLHRRER